MNNYLQLIDRIASAAKISVEDIERKIEAKRAKLSGLVSKEGAAQIVAAELGINFDKERMNIAELVEGMKRVNIFGKVLELSPVRTYSRNGREGKVVNLFVADESSNIKLVLWDTHHISLIEEGKIKKGDVVEVSNGIIRNGELHLSSFGDLKLSKETLGEVKTIKSFNLKKLSDIKIGQAMRTRAVIVQVFDPKYFEVCPECGKKVVEEECAVHGKVQAQRRALLNVILDDGSDTLRAILFNEQIYKLGLGEEEVFSLERFYERKQQLLGEERFFSGIVRSNTLYNTTEFNVENIEEIKPEEVLKELETATGS